MTSKKDNSVASGTSFDGAVAGVNANGDSAKSNAQFNTFLHCLVPEHHLLDEAQVEAVLTKYGIERDHLPKITLSDPGIKALRACGKTINPGDVVEIIRDSETAGRFTAYRLVINDLPGTVSDRS